MQSSKKHHYIPVFYLREWSDINSDRRLVEFSRPYGPTVKPLRKHPSATGYVDKLYELKGLPDDLAQGIEDEFFRPIDDDAAQALKILKKRSNQAYLSASLRLAWSRFILSLMLRSPEDVAQIKSLIVHEWAAAMPALQKKYDEVRNASDPESIDVVLRSRNAHYVEHFGMEIAQNLIDHEDILRLIQSMIWLGVHTDGAQKELLTSDRPVLMSATLGEREAFIILPIGPRTIFVGVNEDHVAERIRHRPPSELVEAVNTFVVQHAVKFAYSRSESPLRFVQKHMSIKPQSSLLDRIARMRSRSPSS